MSEDPGPPFLYVPVTRRGTEPLKCWRCGRVLEAGTSVVGDCSLRHYPTCSIEEPLVPNSLVERAPTAEPGRPSSSWPPGFDLPTTWGWQFFSETRKTAVVVGPRDVWIAAVHLAHAAGHPEVAKALNEIEPDLPDAGLAGTI